MKVRNLERQSPSNDSVPALGRIGGLGLRLVRRWGLRGYVAGTSGLAVLASLILATPAIPVFDMSGREIRLMLFFAGSIPAIIAAITLYAVGKLILHLDQTTQRLQASATTDHLTGVLNRRGFYEAVEKIGAADAREFTVVLADIDHFKQLNDALGHAIGDEGLLVVADWLVALAGPSGVVARIGGDEFVALSDHFGLAELPESWDFLVGGISFSASLGRSAFGAVESDVDDALAMADAQMYRAKRRRPGRTSRSEVGPKEGSHRQTSNRF